jgi:hypothetical protein
LGGRAVKQLLSNNAQSFPAQVPDIKRFFNGIPADFFNTVLCFAPADLQKTDFFYKGTYKV